MSRFSASLSIARAVVLALLPVLVSVMGCDGGQYRYRDGVKSIAF